MMESNRLGSNTREFFKTIANDKKGFILNSVGILEKGNRDLIVDQAELLKAWKEYFENLLNADQEETEILKGTRFGQYTCGAP